MQKAKNVSRKLFSSVKQAAAFVWGNTPLLSKIFFFLFLLALVVRMLSKLFVPFADVFNRYVAHGVRFVLGSLSSFVPLSLAEILILLSPILLVLLILFAVHASKTREGTCRMITFLLSVIALLYFLFVFTYATGYDRSPIGTYFGLEQKEVTPTELAETTAWIIEELNESAKEVSFPTEGASSMPYSYTRMNRHLCDAFETVSKKYRPFFTFESKTKPIFFSFALSHANMLGIHSFFTGEANINVEYPDYTVVYTAAHEMAHQRGVAREDESNFIAFMVCISSEDPYLRYCGYLNMLEYLLNALSAAQYEDYVSLIAPIAPAVYQDMRAYAEVYHKYEKSPVGEVTEILNDNYLKSQGTVGTKSYGMVVDLAVAYYQTHIAPSQ